ncbi:sigma-70 family RNA polymerase sigma factor [Antribacter gilvus]|uniref:sigma-70 family RNA polymerase sigma factor n=1 Tax=Antribacter gilvus TaxID=2304675 RepID=UPI001F0C1301|nr:sigma-70 family RNA polymerase sigma factor [Antribacter gilvus]
MLAITFAEHRTRLRGVAYRILGSLGDAEDAVQEAWLRADAAGTTGVANVPGWLTTITARVCLNMLRARRSRPEDLFDTLLPDPVVTSAGAPGPEDEALLADAVGMALQVVLQSLAPAERVAFVLHDLFAVPFDEIGELLERSPAAVRQLASRARRRVQGEAPAPDPDLAAQRAAVDAFFAAARDGDIDGLVRVLHPDVVLRGEGATGPGITVVHRGARTVASQAVLWGGLAAYARPVLVNGTAGAVAVRDGRVLSVMAFTVVDGRIVAAHALGDRARLARLDLAEFAG